MTAEEIKEQYTEYIKTPSVEQRSKRFHEVVDNICDDFNSRLCENCSYFGHWGPWDLKTKENRYCKVNIHGTGFDYNGYGCNKFERRK